MPPNLDIQRLYGGFRTLQGGVDMGTDPSLLDDSQAAFASNLSFRGDLPTTRQPWLSIPLSQTITGLYQGAACYVQGDTCVLVVSVAGRLYRIDVESGVPAPVTDITPVITVTVLDAFTVPAPAAQVLIDVTTALAFSQGDLLTIDGHPFTVASVGADQLLLTYTGGVVVATVAVGTPIFIGSDLARYTYTNPATLDFVWLFQAEKYLIVLGAQQRPVIYDGVSARLAGASEVPSGVLGIYAWGRIWIVLNDGRSFVAGDLVYGPSGTPAEGFVDAILSFTENDFLNEGGVFTVPSNTGPITAMQVLATIDTSLGIGPLLVGTANSIVSVNAPVDRTTWKNLTYPIQTISLLDYGPLGPRFAIPVNNDMWYRSIDGLRSFLIARRDTNLWGNTPLSHELSPVLADDTQTLLPFGSMMLFDNHVFATIVPRRTAQGVVHDGLAVLNFDSLSTIRGKQPPIWEGIASGLSIHQLVRTTAGGVERAFAFSRAPADGALELWELLPEGDGFYDTYRAVSEDGSLNLVRTPVRSVLETKRYVYDRLVKLLMAELYLDDIVDDVSVRVLWRPDQYPSWVEWATINLCASVTQCTLASPGQFSCTIWKPNARTYAARLRLPTPSEDCNVIAGIPLDRGYEFQFRLECTGHLRLRKFRPHLRIQTDAMVGECPPTSTVCTTFPDCGTEWIDYAIQRT